MITVYAFNRLGERVVGLTRDLRVLWALEELALPYRVHGLDFEKDLNTDEHKRRTPFGQVPVIDDDGYMLAESGAILLYLAEKAGVITPGGVARRYDVTRWCIATLSTVEPALMMINGIALSGASDDGAMKQKAGMIQMANRWLSALDEQLSTRQHIVDDIFTVADILLTTALREVGGLGIVDRFARLHAYQQRCEARPAWVRTLDAYEDRLRAPRGSARRTIPERLPTNR